MSHLRLCTGWTAAESSTACPFCWPAGATYTPGRSVLCVTKRAVLITSLLWIYFRPGISLFGSSRQESSTDVVIAHLSRRELGRTWRPAARRHLAVSWKWRPLGPGRSGQWGGGRTAQNQSWASGHPPEWSAARAPKTGRPSPASHTEKPNVRPLRNIKRLRAGWRRSAVPTSTLTLMVCSPVR